MTILRRERGAGMRGGGGARPLLSVELERPTMAMLSTLLSDPSTSLELTLPLLRCFSFTDRDLVTEMVILEELGEEVMASLELSRDPSLEPSFSFNEAEELCGVTVGV